MDWLTIVKNTVEIFLMAAGAFIMLVGSVGINRLPDFYTRIHAAGKVDTLGIMLFISGLMVYEGLTLNGAKLLLIVTFLLLTSPVASHALARRAYLAKIEPWFGPVPDPPSGGKDGQS